MKIYVLASFKMNPDPERMKALADCLNTGLKQFAEEVHFLNITSSDISFLNDVKRLVMGATPLTPAFNCTICRSKKTKNFKPTKKEV